MAQDSSLRCVRTVVVSDLHLGSRGEGDVLRRRAARDKLLERLDGADRLVLLGDAIELRQGPARDAMAVARPVLEELGGALGKDGEVVLVPGNHDHALVAPWIERRGAHVEPAPLGLEEHPGAKASAATEAIAAWVAPATLTVAYPGIWLRNDVYATHGHYLDRHTTVPTFERLGAGIMGRLVGAVPEADARPDDYEAALAPLYAWMHAMAERSGSGKRRPPSSASAEAWRVLGGDGHRPLRGRLLAGILPLGISGVNRLGLGPVKADFSAEELRRAGVLAMSEVAARLSIEARHVLYGHTHRAGPFADDDSLEWTLPGGGRLTNTGCWVYEALFLARGRSSPYWPGSVVELLDAGPPILSRLLTEVDPDALRAPDRG
jgi:calcineurin-like phosphoesterase family protein